MKKLHGLVVLMRLASVIYRFRHAVCRNAFKAKKVSLIGNTTLGGIFRAFERGEKILRLRCGLEND